jgi:predicted small integral membrane protein
VRGLGAVGLALAVAGIWGPIVGAFFVGGWLLLAGADYWLARRRAADVFRRKE